MTCTISNFDMESYDAVYGLWQKTNGIGLTECDTKEGISTYLLRNPGMSFIAKKGEEIVGAVLSGHDGRRGYIHHLAVRKDFRKKGLGKQLIERCLSTLKNNGINKCHIFIFNDNAEGIDFWKAIGWNPRSDIRIISKDI